MRNLLAWSLASALLASCGGSNGDSVSEPPSRRSIAAADATTTDLIAATGDGAALVFVLRDDGWSEVRKSFATAFNTKAADVVGEFADTADPVAGVWVLTKALDLDLPAPTLAGRDAARPIVVSAFEGAYDGPPGAAIAMTANTDGRHPPSRFQLVIPATDVAALTESLDTWVAARGKSTPELVEGHAGALGFQLGGVSNFGSHVAIIPGRAHVRVVLLYKSHGLSASDVRPWLDVVPAKVPDTPAARHVASGQPMAVLVRPWRLRAFGAWYGLEQAQQAIETVGMDQLNAARAKGTAIASSISILTPDDHAEFDDWAFAASGANGTLSFTAVASLTEQGRQIWKAGTRAVERPFELKRDVVADAFVSADVVAMLAAAGKHDSPEGSMSDLFHTFRMCGALCPTYLAMRWPLAGFKTASGAQPPARIATDAALLGAHIAWVEDGASGPVWAAALVGGDKRVAALGPLLQGMAGRTTLQTHTTKRGDKTVLLLGSGIDPASVFDTETAGPKYSDVARIGATKHTLGLPTQLSGRLSMAGTALTAEATFGPGEVTFAPDFRGLSWPTPMRSAPTSEAASCLQDAVSVVHKQIDAAVSASKAQGPKLFAAAYAAAVGPLKCASADPELAPAARRLGDTIAIIAARGHLARTQVNEARTILRKQCEVTGGTGPACDAAAGLGKLSTPKLPHDADAARCNPDYAWSLGSPMVVGDKQALFAGRTTKATPEAVSAMIIDAMPMESRYEKSAPSVSLAVSGDTPFGTVLPVLSGIVALGGHPSPLVRGKGTDLVTIPIAYDLKSTASIDWKVVEGYRSPFALLEEEEPPPPESPTEERAPEEGKMGKPTAKSKTGLYAMKGPKTALPSMGLLGTARGGRPGSGTAVLAVELTKAELAVVLPDGKRTLVRDPADIPKMAGHIRDLLGRGRELVVTLTVAPDVPWSRYADLSVATCRDPLVLIQP